MAPSPDEAAARLATWLEKISNEASVREGRFGIALSGGSTPELLYQSLTSNGLAPKIDWNAWWCFFSDERACAPWAPESNYHSAYKGLLSQVPIDPQHVFRMPADRPHLEAAAAEYSATLADHFGNPPRLDCVLLGLGENGHTASLFPDTDAVNVWDQWCTIGRADYLPYDRLTLTFPAINAARNVAFLVCGAGKGEALRATAAGKVPAAGIRPRDGELRWFLDEAAASAFGG